MENTSPNLYLMVTVSEANELSNKDGFYMNSFPRVDDDLQVRYYFIDKAWYDHVYFQDYISTQTK